MSDIILLGIVGAVLAWAMLPPAIHPDVARRLHRLPRRKPTLTTPGHTAS